ncbi:hypothetical protein ACIQ7Q_02395 [Streptomyces sp. NPDC096176]|uniref:hypothetical protein n=1 Tax=Streptomyces sp. NPDC096176 TaxID=3366079 RepID=UPI0038234EA0
MDPRFAEALAEDKATLHHEEDRNGLTHASSVLNDFLAVIGRIQAEYHLLSNKMHVSPTVRGDEWTGRNLHA